MKTTLLFIVFVLLAACSESSTATTAADNDAAVSDNSQITDNAQRPDNDEITPPDMDKEATDTEQPATVTIKDFGKPEIVKEGLLFAEGPVWDSAKQALFFSDIDNSVIYRMDVNGTVSTEVADSFKSNGLLLDNGAIIAASWGKRAIIRIAGSTVTTIAETVNGKKFNLPNDLIKSSKGIIYFTDPMLGMNAADSETGSAGIYSISADNMVTLESKNETAPNGIVLSKREDVLYVSDTAANAVYTYSIAAAGRLQNRTKFVDVSAPDGIILDNEGNLYTATHDPKNMIVSIFRPDGTLIGTIPMSAVPTNLSFGGSDGKTLFITTKSALVKVKAPVSGI